MFVFLQIKTPVMIMLGADDKRVPPKQGHELYRALKSRNVPVRYIHILIGMHLYERCHTETGFKVFGFVTPKEGWA